ncbi:Cof-type HAD-IIB family hydrolase [Lacticaseibacillus absianus]|uniref:Cof-type HAD-IIB family hydrolase n=1 Tax=Lacticaseibacillus absianus TaxID=2729623 RepID=UPI0015CB99EE|nr:Cof-type HAD-IIB family hydrolase [Lacticaseibacillus absianus]
MELIGIDLDGTLLNSQQQISAGNAGALIRAQARWLPFICTGRDPEDVVRLLAQVGLTLPIVGLNGGIGVSGGRILFSRPFQPVAALAIMATLADYPVKVYTATDRFETVDYQAQLRTLFDAIGESQFGAGLRYELAYEAGITSRPLAADACVQAGQGILKFYCFMPNRAKRAALAAALRQIPQVTVTSSGPDNLEILPAGTDKGRAFAALRQHFHLGLDRNIAIGDSPNDQAMLNAADLVIIMANASAALRAQADYVTLRNDEDGVAHTLRWLAQVEETLV